MLVLEQTTRANSLLAFIGNITASVSRGVHCAVVPPTCTAAQGLKGLSSQFLLVNHQLAMQSTCSEWQTLSWQTCSLLIADTPFLNSMKYWCVADVYQELSCLLAHLRAHFTTGIQL